MNVENRPINFADQRGIIRDIFPSGSPDCVTLITSCAGAVRGNHVHNVSTQYLFMISGRMLAYSQQVEGALVERRELVPGDLLMHPPHEAHAYLAIEDTVFLAFADGLRKGANYEQDTYRVPSLIDEWAHQRGSEE